MIQAYSGEFTVSPIPLEMSMNYCSHKCVYCFANLNQPDRQFDVNGFISQIKNCKTNNSLTSYLLSNGYPVLISNRVDPFAHSNWRQTLTAIELLNANGNKIAFQTKGGEGIDEALELLDYSAHWYITIAMFSDEVRKKIEPGAPTIESRFKLIEKLLSKGHKVSVGINPIVEEWLPFEDFTLLVDKLVSLGVKEYWMELLHLNHFQTKNLSIKEKNILGDELLEQMKARDGNYSYLFYCKDYLIEKGLDVFQINQPLKSNYFNSIHSEYKTLKTHQDFVNYCFEKYPNGGEIKWHEYYNFMKEDFFEQTFNECDGYVYRTARNLYTRLKWKPFKTLKQVLECFWENVDIYKSLFLNDLFSVLSYEENGESLQYYCKEDNKIIYWFNAKPDAKLRHFINN